MKLAALGEKFHPYGSEVIREKRYVDDILDASSSMEKIVLKRDETQELLGKFRFKIKAWNSNHAKVGNAEQNCKVLGT